MFIEWFEASFSAAKSSVACFCHIVLSGGGGGGGRVLQVVGATREAAQGGHGRLGTEAEES